MRFRVALLLVALACIAPDVSWARIVIHEIHYNPAERGQALEFVELVNTGTTSIDLSEWRFTEGIDFTFPKSVSLAPGSHLVIAEDPKALKETYEIDAWGPWEGKLSNAGETLTLRDNANKKVDEVDYGVGFPWPSAAAGGGASIELIHPELDNDLGGSWRSSIAQASTDNGEPKVFVTAESTAWRYMKGTREAPRNWHRLAFDARRWTQAQTPIGYADRDDRTVLRDMLGNYSTVYLRNIFEVARGTPLDRPLSLRVYCDDGAVIWINGREVGRLRVTDRVPNHRTRTTRNHEAAWETIMLAQPRRFLRPGKNVLAILAVNGQINSSDFSIDAELAQTATDAIPPQPTPGEANRSESDAPPPQVRQVSHEPALPKSGQAVTISAKVTDPDGVANVTLLYQQLLPGRYISKDDRNYKTTWKELPMSFSEGRYAIKIPGDWQKHRHLLRYRILAEDKLGAKIRIPYADDAQANFAYFCYDGAPAWTGADRPGRTQPKTFPKSTMNGLPTLNLLAYSQDIEDSQYRGSYNERFFPGTLVVGSRVYDHIRFRNRGETTTYMVGKNKWRINFNRTHELPAHTLDGKTESKNRRWKRLNLNPGTVPYHPSFRGNASLNERLAFRLYQLAGLPSPDTAFTQLRVIDDPSEAGQDQYSGDLWGLYMGFEAIDGFMLDNHDEPDSDLIRMKQSGNTITRTSLTPPPEGLDYWSFWNGLRRRQPAEWWKRAVDLDRYYRFHAVSLATARIDQKLNHNHFLHRHPERGWQALPWDADACLRPVRYDPDHHRWHPMLKYCLAYEDFRIAYQNRGRELLDLLFTKEIIENLVNELVKDLGPIDQQASWAEIDRFLWNYHPQTTSRHRGRFFVQDIRGQRLTDHEPSANMRFETTGFAERVQYFKDYLTPAPAKSEPGKEYRGWGHQQLLRNVRDLETPLTPRIQRTKARQALTFVCSAFKDLQGAKSFGGIRWRIAPSASEWEAEWESEVLGKESTTYTFSNLSLTPGETYRVRARYVDDTGRASHWSPPVEILAEAPDVSRYTRDLQITEIMYHPVNDGPEFIELTNMGKRAVDLKPLQFTKGIECDLSRLTTTTLAPSARLVLVDDVTRFTSTYPDSGKARIHPWDSGKLSNKGERLELSYGAHSPVLEIRYDDTEPWPAAADGQGPSLEWVASGKPWRASEKAGGSPGE